MHQAIPVIATLLALATSSCVISPYPQARSGGYYPPGHYQGAPEDPGVIVDMPPPAPYVEVVPLIPFVGALWLGGYWGWSGGRHQWVPGRWEQPRAGYGWRPHAWSQQGGRWHLREGGWYRQ
jgi:hypothetical protein